MEHKGSKKHILELIDSNDFIATLNTILLPYQAKITDKKYMQPKGSMDVSECGIQSFINKNKLKERFPTLIDFDFNKWWSPHSGKTPTWDMISLCKLDGKDAILLVEAKAHQTEFAKSGKTKLKLDATEDAKKNLKNIEDKIEEACISLNTTCKGFNISTTKTYQLSNRVAFAWKLNQLEVPVILLYLGFTNDTYFTDKFGSKLIWEEKFNKYIDGVIPSAFINTMESEFLFLQSSLDIK